MNSFTIEVVATSVQSCINAQAGGARRIELCIEFTATGVLNYFIGTKYFVPPAYNNKFVYRRESGISLSDTHFIEVFPSPANMLVNFKLNYITDFTESTNLILYDITGKQVASEPVLFKDQFISIDKRSLPSGLYTYRVELPYGKVLSGRVEVIH